MLIFVCSGRRRHTRFKCDWSSDVCSSDLLFERICRLPEYYLTRAELALTRAHLPAIARFAGSGGVLLEYGSGESLKTRLLLRAMRPSVYMPVDISEDALRLAVARLGRAFPRLRIAPLAGDFSRP